MKFSNKFIVSKIVDTNCVLPIGQSVIDTDSIYKLNDTGAFVLSCLKEEKSEEELFYLLCEKYQPENDEELNLLKSDMIAFLDSAKQEKIIID